MSRFREDGLPQGGTGGPLRITKEELESSHVDDLLKRQANMRGDTGITADRSRRWYYSNWFIFALAGGIFATLAWFLLEPLYSDTLHIRTKIAEVTPIEPGHPLEGRARAMITIEDETAIEDLKAQMPDGASVDLAFVITPDTVVLGGDEGATAEFDLDLLQPGTEVGLHIDHVSTAVEETPTGIAVIMRVAGVEGTPAGGAYKNYRTAKQVSESISLVFFAIISSIVGLGIGAADGLMCRLMRRAIMCGVAGLLVGFVGGFVSGNLANVVYSPISQMAQKMDKDAEEQTTAGFLAQLGGRSLGWALAGMTMGLGQGIVLRSGKLLLYGFLGGLIGGLLGGLLFDPIQMFLVPETEISAHWARLAGIVAVGATVGLMIGIVELLARDAWLNMVRGPLAGKEFLIFKDTVKVGASPSSDIYLFNDEEVADHHAVIRAMADNYEIETVNQNVVQVNGRPVTRTKLRHGDQIKLGSTIFAFQRRQTA